jgi:hypothetical protein
MNRNTVNELSTIRRDLGRRTRELRIYAATDASPAQRDHLYAAALSLETAWQQILNATRIDETKEVEACSDTSNAG